MNRDVKLSKTLSWILRHGANEVGVKIDAEGFASAEEILRLKQLRGFTIEDLRRVVENNSKQRFTIKQTEQGFMIKANQGHSMVVEQLELKEITSHEEYPIVVHGSYHKNWDTIKSKGLSRMTRQHIHFASDVYTGSVISGMRNDCDLLIFVDLEKALLDGYSFFVSPNGVILCPGNIDGILPVYYFKEVYRTVNGERHLLETK